MYLHIDSPPHSVAVVMVTAVFWIPISCVISYFDRKKLRYEIKQIEWSQKPDLIHPSDERRRIIHIRYSTKSVLQYTNQL